MCDLKGINDIREIEKISIDSVSFVPTDEEINLLLETSKIAIKTLESKVPNCLLSKIPALIPKSFNPNDTILIKVATGLPMYTVETATSSKIELVRNYLYVLNDRDVPYVSTSNGPNGILIDCQSQKYGKNRMNLFHKSKKQTFKLLNDYIVARNKNINKIFQMFVLKLNSYTGDNKDIIEIGTMFIFLANKLSNSDNKLTLKKLGIGVNSFCQTWLRKKNDKSVSLNAQFSVPSPHFQTRFFIEDEQKLLNNGVHKYEIEAYKRVIKKFTVNMQENYGECGEGKSFINLDKLLLKMKNN